MTAAAPALPTGKRAAWRLAIRVPTLTASVAPVLVGTAVAIHLDGFRAGPALAALIGAICLQIAANFANDVSDFRRGADTPDRLGPPRVTQLGLLTQREVTAGLIVVIALATLCGAYLAYETGWEIIAIGIASIIGALIYTGGPWPIGYHALGDVFTFAFFGPIAVAGTVFVQMEAIPGLAWAASIPIGCTVTAILVVNNLRDVETDRRARKVTLAVVMGEQATRYWYLLLLVVATAVALGTWLFGSVSFLALAVLLSLVTALPPLRAVLGGVRGRPLNLALKGTARFNLAFAVCFALAIALS